MPGDASGEPEFPPLRIDYRQPRLDSIEPSLLQLSTDGLVAADAVGARPDLLDQVAVSGASASRRGQRVPLAVTFRGSDFGPSADVTLGGAPLRVLEATHDQVVALIPPGQGRATLRLFAATQTFPDEVQVEYDAPAVEGAFPLVGRTDGCVRLEGVGTYRARI